MRTFEELRKTFDHSDEELRFYANELSRRREAKIERNGLIYLVVVVILAIAVPLLAHAQSYYGNSQGEGNYNGSVGGTGNYTGMQNSHGAAQGGDSDWKGCTNCDHSGDQD